MSLFECIISLNLKKNGTTFFRGTIELLLITQSKLNVNVNWWLKNRYRHTTILLFDTVKLIDAPGIVSECVLFYHHSHHVSDFFHMFFICYHCFPDCMTAYHNVSLTDGQIILPRHQGSSHMWYYLFKAIPLLSINRYCEQNTPHF